METVIIECRCKDCVHSEKDWSSILLYCYFWEYEQGMSPNVVNEDDFCSNGKLK